MLVDQGKYSFEAAVQEKLESLAFEYSEMRSGYRQGIYKMLAAAMEIVVFLRDQSLAEQGFWAYLNVRKTSNLPLEVVAHIMTAKGVRARKLASKRAQAMCYLYDNLGIPLDELAAGFKKHGGIEKICARARGGDSEDCDQPSLQGSKIALKWEDVARAKVQKMAKDSRVKIVGELSVAASGQRSIRVVRAVRLRVPKKKEPSASDW